MPEKIKCENCGLEAITFYEYIGPMPESPPNDQLDTYSPKCIKHQIVRFTDHWRKINRREFVVGKVMGA